MSTIANNTSNNNEEQSPNKKQRTEYFPAIDLSVLDRNAQENQQKQRHTRDSLDFCVTISPCQLFTLVSTLKNLLNTVTINVVNKESFKGLQCDSTSPAMTCMVKSKLACTVYVHPDIGEKTNFIVHVSEFADVIKECTSKGTQTIEIFRERGSSTLTLDCPRAVPRDTFQLRTLVQETVDSRLQKMKILLQVQLKLHEIKAFCQSCVKFKAETISITVLEKESDKGSKVQSYVVLGFQSDALTRSMKFPTSIEKNENGEMQAVCDKTGAGGNINLSGFVKKYSEHFAVEFLNQFFKSIDRNQIWMNLTADEGPMIVHYSLGNDQSYMRLVLAPKSED